MPQQIDVPGIGVVEFPDGMNDDQIAEAIRSNLPQGSSAPGISTATAAGRGAAQGLTLGLNDEMRGVIEAGGVAPNEPASLGGLVRGGFNLLTGSGQDAYRAAVDRTRNELEEARKQAPIATTVGEVGGALAGGLGLAGSGLSLGANAARAGGGLLRTAVGSAADGAILGAVQGAGSADEGSRLEGAAYGGGVGAGIGLAAPYVVAGASNAFRRAVTPLPTSADRLAAARALESEGVPLTAGQKSGNRVLKYAESELGGGKIADITTRQNEAFTDAAMRKAGASGLATPDNLASLQKRLGQEFEGISARNTLTPDRQFGQDVGTTLNRYGRLLEVQQKPIISNVVDDLIERLRVNNGAIPGTEYQAIRSDLSLAARSTTNPALSGAFKGIRNALDDAMERSVNKADAGKWKELRRQYGNFKTIQRASVGGGEDAGFGIISPARLRMAASSGNREGFSTGASDFTNLAKAGQAMMTPMPQSGTAPRSAMRHFASSLMGGGGAMVAGLPGLAAGMAAPMVVGRALLSKPVQSYLTNQAFSKSASPQMRAFASLLLTNAALGRRDHP